MWPSPSPATFLGLDSAISRQFTRCFAQLRQGRGGNKRKTATRCYKNAVSK